MEDAPKGLGKKTLLETRVFIDWNHIGLVALVEWYKVMNVSKVFGINLLNDRDIASWDVVAQRRSVENNELNVRHGDRRIINDYC